jgi:hypothetical protein
MTLPRTVADVLNDHVVFEVECIAGCISMCTCPGCRQSWRHALPGSTLSLNRKVDARELDHCG